MFDLQGRRVSGHLAPGIYWRVDHCRHKKKVVVLE